MARWPEAALAVGVAAAMASAVEPAGAQEAVGTAGVATLAEGVTGTVVSLRRLPRDGLVQLDYRLDNAGTTPVTLEALGLVGSGDCVDEFGLIDFAGGNQYLVGYAGNFCLSSSVADAPVIAAGASFEGWAWFRPPETLAGLVWVRMGEAFPIFDVPLQ